MGGGSHVIGIRLDDSELRALSRDLAVLPATVAARAPALVRHWGQLLETRVKLNAATGFHAPGEPHIPGTGPGPNVATGDYLRSISAEYFQEGSTIAVSVGTNAVQGARLEWGFDEADSLGRVYHQPPFPHHEPGLDEIEPQFVEAATALGARL
jgi:hypothetical protein